MAIFKVEPFYVLCNAKALTVNQLHSAKLSENIVLQHGEIVETKRTFAAAGLRYLLGTIHYRFMRQVNVTAWEVKYLT